MQATLLLADYAVVQDGKLNLIGAGWTVISGGDRAVPIGIGVIFAVPWDQANQPHEFQIKLVDEDGKQAMFQTNPEGPGEPLIIPGQFEVGRPPGVPPGTTLQSVIAINLGPLPLPPGRGYAWRLELDGNPEALAVRPFRTRDAP